MDGMFYRPERNNGKIRVKRDDNSKLIFITIVGAVCVLGAVLLSSSVGVAMQTPEEFPYVGAPGH